MVKIAIVDDERDERDLLRSHFRKLQEEIREEFELCEYSSGLELLENMDREFDLICLDIDMEKMDGIQTAREVRRLDSQVLIIFITNLAQMAIQGYEVRALDFIVKPLNYYSFSLKIKSAVDIIANRKVKNILIGSAGELRRISTDDLYYAEVFSHDLFYHTKDGVYKQRAPLKELEDNLRGLSFKRCNNSYLVNLKYVDCVEKGRIRIGGEWLRISRPRRKEFLQALANYMGGLSI
ncbi:MAG: LytTR family DNA-binding domain-containing protein [Clostridiales bacterium]|nr:LytTR family DNA-binding domain-containing protein [Clostridiales bacterium]